MKRFYTFIAMFSALTMNSQTYAQEAPVVEQAQENKDNKNQNKPTKPFTYACWALIKRPGAHSQAAATLSEP